MQILDLPVSAEFIVWGSLKYGATSCPTIVFTHEELTKHRACRTQQASWYRIAWTYILLMLQGVSGALILKAIMPLREKRV